MFARMPHRDLMHILDLIEVVRHCTQGRLDPGQETDLLTTPGNGFLFVISGDPTVSVDNESFTCGTGDIVCLPPRRNGITVGMRAGREESRVVIALANLSGLVGVAMGADLALTSR